MVSFDIRLKKKKKKKKTNIKTNRLTDIRKYKTNITKELTKFIPKEKRG